MNTEIQQSIDPTRLSAEDAYIRSPPSDVFASGNHGSSMRNSARRVKVPQSNRSRSRRKKSETWKKLLWVKHPFPDNYTDEETFLDHLQRNPRLQPYEFWPLVADSTVIVQQLCAVTLFVCCFSGIIQERISPITVVTSGTIFTVLGWILWDYWCGREEIVSRAAYRHEDTSGDADGEGILEQASRVTVGLGLDLAHGPADPLRLGLHSRDPSTASTKLSSVGGVVACPSSMSQNSAAGPFVTHPSHAVLDSAASQFSPRNQRRVATLKSALLIYCALLGLSPILKSLTKSTASDSIWAISFWLMCINIFFFDYGGGIGEIFSASLSTNAALMASTVLASRLPSTTHVFSLTLFSIEVFGLFPIFRRYLRHVSWRGHLTLTWALIMSASGGVAVIITSGGLARAVLGVILGCLVTGFVMGLASYWLITLQKYKNEIHGPWDPARPVIRRRWD